MKKQVFIINGSGGCGKDEFIKLIQECSYGMPTDKIVKVANYSSVTKVKEIAKIIGWSGKKTEKDRKFLSDLKSLTVEYNDMPLNDMKRYVKDFMSLETPYSKIIFLHIREPEEIIKAVNEFAEYDTKTILMTRESIEQITSNVSDRDVYNYNYDFVIKNDGTIEDLKEKAEWFLNDFLNNDFKTEY